jgi:hypothetical protein
MASYPAPLLGVRFADHKEVEPMLLPATAEFGPTRYISRNAALLTRDKFEADTRCTNPSAPAGWGR